MKRSFLAAGTAVLLLTACTPAPKENKVANPGTPVSGTVELWHFFTEREAKAIASVVKDFEAAHPTIKVTVKSGQDDSKVTQAIGAGRGPDVGLSYSTDIVGKFCSSGAWVDLTQYVQRDKVDLNKLNATTRQYTQFDGKRCAMPFLADAYGLFYNKDLFAKAGISGPPKTLDELSADAKKLTVKNPDGSLKTVGFLPLFDFYENAAAHLAPAVGAKWLTDEGKSAVGSDPAWKTLLTWQKSLIDWYGYDNLQKFRAGLATSSARTTRSIRARSPSTSTPSTAWRSSRTRRPSSSSASRRCRPRTRPGTVAVTSPATSSASPRTPRTPRRPGS